MTKKESNKTLPQVNFAFHKITTEQFAIIEEAYGKEKKIEVTIDTNFTVEPSSRAVGSHVLIKFNCDQVPFIIIKVACFFAIVEGSWNTWIMEDKSINVPAFFATHMVATTIGTMRGVLHTKTEGSYFNKYIVPPINVTTLITEDVKFILQIKADGEDASKLVE